MHYGVKGMKWGVRHDPELVGRHRRYGQAYANSTPYRGQNRSYNSNQHRSGSSSKVKAAKKVAIGAAIVAGGVLAAYGGAKVGKVLTSQAGREAIKKGAKAFGKKVDNAAYKARNASKVGRNVIRTPIRMFNRTPVGRVVKAAGKTPVGRAINSVRKFNPVPKSFRGTLAGQLVGKAYAGAVLASDINTVHQWSQSTKRKGRVTKKDVARLVKDLALPIPDNLPGVSKNRHE